MNAKSHQERKACRAERKRTLRSLGKTGDEITRRWIAAGCLNCGACRNFIAAHNFEAVTGLYRRSFIEEALSHDAN